MDISGSSPTTVVPKFPYFQAQPSLLRKSHPKFTRFGNQRRRLIRCSSSPTREREETSIPWGCEMYSLESSSRLQKWLSKEGLPPQKLAIQRVDVGDRGLVALKNIRKGEKLLFVPESLIITNDSAWSCPLAGDILSRNGVPEWPFLATYLISEASLGNSSRWGAYISALPRHPGSILQWTLSEVDLYLAASPVKEQAIEHITDVTETYQDLRLRIFSKYPDLFPEKVFNMETFKWGFGILFSRLVRLPSKENRVALVPWADMLNHSSEVDVFLDFDRSSKGIIFATDRAYQPREQVFISYGKKSNGELLLSYGFVPREGTNVANSVELSLAIDKHDSCYEQKLEILQQQGLSTPQKFPLKMSGWSMQLLAYAFLVVSPPTMAQQFEKMAFAASNTGAAIHEMNYPVELQIKAFQVILNSCEMSISAYTKFLEDMQENGNSDLSKNVQKQVDRKSLLKQLSIDLCSSEQRILFRAQYALRRRLQDLRHGGIKALNILDGVWKFLS